MFLEGESYLKGVLKGEVVISRWKKEVFVKQNGNAEGGMVW